MNRAEPQHRGENPSDQREFQQLREAIDTIPAIAWTSLPDNSKAIANRRWAEYTGLPKDDPSTWHSVVHPDDRETAQAKWQQSLTTGEPMESEARYRCAATGEYRWFLSRAEAVRDEKGNIVRWYGILTDIEDRKRMEQSLRRSEAYLEEAQRLTHTGSWAYRPAVDQAIHGSKEIFRILGLDSELSLPDMSRFLDIIHPEDRAKVAECVERALRDKTDFTYGSKILLQDGTVKHIHAIGHAVIGGDGALEYIGTIADITDRKQAVEELRASEARFRVFVDHATDAFFLHNEQMVIVDVNHQACHSLGYSREELIGMRPHDYDAGLNQAQIARLAERVRTGETVSFESLHRRKDGTVFPIEARVRPFSQGGERFFLGCARDITDRKCAEEELRRSEARFRTFADHATDAFFVHDSSGTILDVNREACKTLGYTRDELIGMHPYDFDRGQATPPTALTRARLEAGETMTFESVAQRKDSSTVPLEWRVRRYQQGENWFALSSARDISERKRAEEELREAETRFRTFVDQATDAFFVIDVDTGAILDVNRRACENLGYKREELIGKTLLLFDIDLTLDWIAKNLRPRLEGGASATFETRHRRKDGSVFPVEVRSRRFEYGGKVVTLSLALDITERRRAEEEHERLRQLEADLAHINRVSMMGELAASIAHEINQPLSGVVTNGSACIGWLDGDSPNLEEARAAALRIVRDGKRAGEVIARIRSLATSAAIPKERLDLNETIRDVLALLVNETKKNGITTGTQLADDLSPVMGDRVQLQQVVLNLVMNAIEATSSVKGSVRDLIIRTSNVDADEVRVEVQDSGVGLEPDKIGKLFAPFYSTKPGGMGMGLSISRSIIRSHGGQLSATPNTGPGATFYFTLPKLRLVEIEAG